MGCQLGSFEHFLRFPQGLLLPDDFGLLRFQHSGHALDFILKGAGVLSQTVDLAKHSSRTGHRNTLLLDRSVASSQ
jgi:hypothetical protein